MPAHRDRDSAKDRLKDKVYSRVRVNRNLKVKVRD